MTQEFPRVVQREKVDADFNPKDRQSAGKPKLHLIPPTAMVIESVVMELGAKKYGQYNWRVTDVRATVYLDAAYRHLTKWFDGEENDPESGVSHLAHARACLGILIDAGATGHLMDDRPPVGVTSAVIEQMTQPVPDENHDSNRE